MTNIKNDSDSDDSAPDSISFDKSKLENAKQSFQIKEQVLNKRKIFLDKCKIDFKYIWNNFHLDK